MTAELIKDPQKIDELASGIKIRGFFRVAIRNEDGKLIGDSGFRPNVVVNDGFNDYIVRLMGSLANSKKVSHAALGTGTQPGAADTTLDGEITHAAGSRQALTAASSSNSKKLRFTGTFSSSDSFVTASVNISNIGLFQQSNTNTATIMAGNTYTSSALATNNNVEITYDLDFS